MFCPQCRAEYRSGFTQCSDCYLDLVAELPKEQLPSGEALTLLWECAEERECVGVCRDLQNADIPYKVDQIPYERVGMRMKWHYRILISPGHFDRAKEVLGIDGPQHTIPADDGDDDEEVLIRRWNCPIAARHRLKNPSAAIATWTRGIPKTP